MQEKTNWKELEIKANELVVSGAVDSFIKDKTSAFKGESKMYKVGELVNNTDIGKNRKDPEVIFLSTIRWKPNGRSYGGYVVLDKNGKMKTTTNISKK
jgi:hypothetical protein